VPGRPRLDTVWIWRRRRPRSFSTLRFDRPALRHYQVREIFSTRPWHRMFGLNRKSAIRRGGLAGRHTASEASNIKWPVKTLGRTDADTPDPAKRRQLVSLRRGDRRSWGTLTTERRMQPCCWVAQRPPGCSAVLPDCEMKMQRSPLRSGGLAINVSFKFRRRRRSPRVRGFKRSKPDLGDGTRELGGLPQGTIRDNAGYILEIERSLAAAARNRSGRHVDVRARVVGPTDSRLGSWIFPVIEVGRIVRLVWTEIKTTTRRDFQPRRGSTPPAICSSDDTGLRAGQKPPSRRTSR